MQLSFLQKVKFNIILNYLRQIQFLLQQVILTCKNYVGCFFLQTLSS